MIKILYSELDSLNGLGIITPSIDPMLFSYVVGARIEECAIGRFEYVFNDYLKRLKGGVEMEKVDPCNYKSLFGLGKYRIKVFNSQSPVMMWEDFLDDLPIIGSVYSPQYALFDKSPKILHEKYRGQVRAIKIFNTGTTNEHYEMITWDLNATFG